MLYFPLEIGSITPANNVDSCGPSSDSRTVPSHPSDARKDGKSAQFPSVGFVLAWYSPSVFSTPRLVSVLTAAPLLETKAAWQHAGHQYDARRKVSDIDISSVGGCDYERSEKRAISPEERVASLTAADGSCSGIKIADVSANMPAKVGPPKPRIGIGMMLDWPKRPAPPLLEFLDRMGSAPELEIGVLHRVVQFQTGTGNHSTTG